jgi:hypothetical protein
MNAAAAMRIPIPSRLGLASLYPSNAMTEVATTQAASTNSNTPAILAARRSVSPRAALAWNRQSTTTADASSMALSPPKASNAGLCARHAANKDTAASALIQTIVIA